MDTIGLLAAWVGILSILLSILIGAAVHVTAPLVRRWWARTSPARAARRIEKLSADLERSSASDEGYIADLISLYGSLVLTLVGGAALVIVSIEILDLGPALLAAVLPFNINAKLLTRITGLFLLAGSYAFVLRFSFLLVRLRLRTVHRTPEFSRIALREIARLRTAQTGQIESPIAAGAAQSGVR